MNAPGRSILLVLSIVISLKIITYAWRPQNTPLTLAKRDVEFKCDDIYQQADQCAFAHDYCTAPGLINYIQLYFCSISPVRLIVLILMCSWLLFLFGFVGIAASDFFCPNLQTIASVLHLSESLTGVTFLAFGNGSPDLFSTFSAMQSNMGSLALGELIGAAAFIASVVAGCMCVIQPFAVKKLSFFRDVMFFSASIVLILCIVADGYIHLYESILLIVFYVIYVIVVVGANYYMKRQSTYQNLVQRARLEYEESGAEVNHLIRGNMRHDEPRTDGLEEENEDEHGDVAWRHNASNDYSNLRVRTSLFSAIEFQDVVHSLQNTNMSYYRFSNLQNRRFSHRSTNDEQDNTNDISMEMRGAATEAGPQVEDTPQLRWRRRWMTLRSFVERLGWDVDDMIFRLFPSLERFEEKSLFGKVSALLSAPVIFLLAITLPVVKDTALQHHHSSGGAIVLDDQAASMLANLPEEALNVPELGKSTAVWSRWLTAVQFVCAPIMLATVVSINTPVSSAILMPIATVFGIGTSMMFWLTTKSEHQPRLYWMMCFAGFAMAVVWIYVIANEVVGVLQAVGLALGISEAILGLTVFAVGNSLGDLVANVTMARLGYPLMALSACFGGPMLSVGIGATYMTSRTGEAFAVHIPTTIYVSAIGLLTVLLSSLIFTPLNGFRMSKGIGYVWIGIYLLCTAINLFLEQRS